MKKEHALFTGIIQSAHTEAEAITQKGLQEIEDLQNLHDKKISAAIEQEQKMAEKKRKELALAHENAIKNLERTHHIETTKKLRKLSEEAIYRKMDEMVGTKEYEHALTQWIAEAAIALDTDEAKVATSKKEQITPQMLDAAKEIIEKVTSRKMKLTLETAFLSSQGVVVSTLSNTVAYNNQVKTRLKRCTSDFELLLEGSICQKK
jgi:vacuolar-type H+-ATPase subunit E/Vma4